MSSPEKKSSPNTLTALKWVGKLGLDPFVLLLVLMVVLARLFPGPGTYEGTVSLHRITSLAVSGIFFFYGLKLSPEKLVAGLSRWKVHLLIQSFTFGVFPLLVGTAMLLFRTDTNQYLWLGIFFLAALPSTVSSSIVMVSIAGGNLPVAIFNASISSLLGVFLTPLWMGLFLNTSAMDRDLSGIIGTLCLQVLLPIVLGLLLHRRWGGFADRHKKGLRLFDQAVILAIVYQSFCESFARHLFGGFDAGDLLLLSAAMLGLFLLVYWIIRQVCALLHFDRAETIAAIFCGSKKSLVHGTVLSQVLFAGSTVTGMILLPLMLYHALQIITGSFMARRMATGKLLAGDDHPASPGPDVTGPSLPSR